jgi:hypothetical protein
LPRVSCREISPRGSCRERFVGGNWEQVVKSCGRTVRLSADISQQQVS